MINWQRTRMTHFSEVLQLQCKVFVRFARNQRPAFWEPTTMMRMRVRMMKTTMTYQQEPITKKPHHGSVLLHQQLMEEK